MLLLHFKECRRCQKITEAKQKIIQLTNELIAEYKAIGPDAYFRKYAAPLRPEGFEIARQKAEEEMKIRPLKKLGEVCRKLLKKQD